MGIQFNEEARAHRVPTSEEHPDNVDVQLKRGDFTEGPVGFPDSDVAAVGPTQAELDSVEDASDEAVLEDTKEK